MGLEKASFGEEDIISKGLEEQKKAHSSFYLSSRPWGNLFPYKYGISSFLSLLGRIEVNAFVRETRHA